MPSRAKSFVGQDPMRRMIFCGLDSMKAHAESWEWWVMSGHTDRRANHSPEILTCPTSSIHYPPLPEGVGAHGQPSPARFAEVMRRKVRQLSARCAGEVPAPWKHSGIKMRRRRAFRTLLLGILRALRLFWRWLGLRIDAYVVSQRLNEIGPAHGVGRELGRRAAPGAAAKASRSRPSVF